MQWVANLRTRLTAKRESRSVGARLIFAGLTLASVVAVSVALLSLRSIAAPESAQPQKTSAAPSSSKTLSDAEMRMSSTELTRYVFDHHGCNNCHTLSASWQVGFTDRGKLLSKGFEGCAALLTAMNVIAQVEPAERSADEKAKAARFQDFGCTTCHQIVPGEMALTSYGKKIKSMHLTGCTVDLCCAKPRK